MSTTPQVTAEILRSRIARARLPKYIVGATCRINPITLSRLLNERAPLTQEMGERIMAAIRTLEAAHGR